MVRPPISPCRNRQTLPTDGRNPEVLIHTLSFLEPQALLGASLVSKRFHALVNSSQLWRAAFVQFFPPPHVQLDGHGSPLSPQDRRYFTRLCPWDATENAWMKEHMQRTRLLRRLGRGTHRGLQVTYPARTGRLSVSHMAARFTPTGIRAVHASLEAEVVTASDPTTGIAIFLHLDFPRPCLTL